MPVSITPTSGAFRPMMYLAMPVLVEQMLNMLVGLVDTWIAGNFFAGDDYVAAIGLMAYILWLLPCMFSAVAIGATAMVARFVGAGNPGLAVRVANQAFLAGMLVALVGTAAVYLAGDAFIGLMRLRGEAFYLAARYLHILVPVIPAMMVQMVGIACLRGAGDTVSGFVTMAIVNVINIAVSVTLVVGPGPIPALGWDGLAIGTAVGYVVGAAIILGLFLVGRAGMHLRWRLMVFDADLFRRLFRVGLPGGADIATVLFCHLWFVQIINTIGTQAAAAHGVGVRIESLGYLPGAAFAVAATTLTGQYLGAGAPAKAMRSALLSLLVGGVIMTAAGALFFFAAQPLSRCFLGPDKEQTVALAAELLRIVSFAMPPLAVAMILTGALRGAGDTRWPLLFTFIAFLGFRIPAAYYLAWEQVPLPLLDVTIEGMGLGVAGAWYAMVAEVVLRALLVAGRFWHGGWMRIQV